MENNSAGTGIRNLLLSLTLGCALVVMFLVSSAFGEVEAGVSPSDSTSATAGVRFVAPGGYCGLGNPCYGSVQAAVDAAAEGDEIWVATGTYTGTGDHVVRIDKPLTLRGGYTSTIWGSPDAPRYPTILDGEGERSVVRVEAVTATIAGFRVTGGITNGLGGGVLVLTSSVTLLDNQVFSNASGWGGGIYVKGSPLARLDGNVITGNVAQIGGGVYIRESDSVLSGNRVESNRAETNVGGGIYQRGGVAQFTDNLIRDNHAPAYAGGGIFLRYPEAGSSLVGNEVVGNSAGGAGGGLTIQAGHVEIRGNTVSHNEAGSWGGGGYVFSSDDVIFEGNVLMHNEAGRSGGALYLHRSDPLLQANQIVGNVARTEAGGGFYLQDASPVFVNTVIAENSGQLWGGGITVWDGDPTFLHSTLARNRGGISGLYVGRGSTAMTNNIVVSHTRAIYVEAGAEARLEGTLWGAGSWANLEDCGGEGNVVTGSHNYWADPVFVDPEAGDYHIEWASGAANRAVDAGVMADMDGHPRPIGDGFDLGADETTGLDLSSSYKRASADVVAPGDAVTYTVVLSNGGVLDAEDTRLADQLPASTTYISGSARASSGVLTDADGIHWRGSIAPEEAVTITYQVTVEEDVLIRNTVLITDAYGDTTELTAWINPERAFFPLVLR